MSDKAMLDYYADLRVQLNKLPNRPAKGELLREAMEIPLEWPDWENPADRPLAQQLTMALLPWGGKVHAVASPDEVPAKINELIESLDPKVESPTVARWKSDRLNQLNLEEGLGDAVGNWHDLTPEAVSTADTPEARQTLINSLAGIDAAIIDCDYCVAHTASLVLAHDAIRDGLTNVLAWTLIPVVWESQVVSTIQDVIDRLRSDFEGKRWPRHTVFNTGPSRSGDIDLVAGQGAAGPGRFHLILVQGS